MNLSNEMYSWAKHLFPINRSLTGEGVRETLDFIKNILPDLKIHSVPTGTEVFDWTVPNEWNVKEAYIEGPNGDKIINFEESNLHLLGYSIPIDTVLSLSELQKHLYSLPEQPNAIPYITSYYKERWGFCLTEDQRQGLPEGEYKIKIDSVLKPGVLNYGELIIPGETDEEIFLSTYVCHPSMGNNELSGPIVTTALARWIESLNDRKYTYRIVFIPETIGSITYLSRNISHLKNKVVAGFVLTCIGDDRTYSYLESRNGNTLADKAAKHALKDHFPNFKTYSFLERGSDERQYGAPGVDLPICSVMRTKYGEYPEYHTSLDNLDLISPEGLLGGFEVVQKCITILEMNEVYQTTILCEPQLGKRGLYPTLSTKESGKLIRNMVNIIAYSDGTKDLIDISDYLNLNMIELKQTIKTLLKHKIIKKVE